jgi:hypothetical protein
MVMNSNITRSPKNNRSGMGIKLWLLILPAALLFSCGQRTENRGQGRDDKVARIENLESFVPQSQMAFLGNLASLCGKSFRGKEKYSAPGRDSWANRDFVMHVTECGEDKVHIPFHLDRDKSRTWMFMIEEEGLRFRHDHRHQDGTPEEITMYGGYADGPGTAFMQKFPADEYTVELLGEDLGREWMIILSEDLSSLTYELHYSGRLMFAAEFDLTSAI